MSDEPLNSCACCDPVPPPPGAPSNPPGLPALAYRLGTHARFKAAMLAAIATKPELARLTTRADDDPAIALLDRDGVYGAPRFHAAAKAVGIRAIIGAELTIAPAADGREPVRYQGLVALESDSLAGAFEAYFRQSEQLPTALLLAANGERAAGLMLQKLPGETGDEDAWRRVEALFDTLHAPELLAGPDTDLLWRLFHEDGVRVLSQQPLTFHCSCSLARVEEMFQGLGEAEAMAALQEGEARVHCEFCGRDYRVDAGRMQALFAPGARPNASGSPGLQ